MSNVLAFPVQLACPTCGRPCGEDELSECTRCGQRYCQQDSWDCECDRTAREILARAQRGFTLIELLVVMSVFLILACVALPSAVRVMQVSAQSTARKRAQTVWSVMGEDAVCHQLGTNCAGLDALVPPTTPVTAGMYTYSFTGVQADGSWTYTATPTQASLHSFTISNTGALVEGP